MKYLVRILPVNDQLEHILNISLFDQELEVFVPYMNKDVNFGAEYLVDLEPVVLDEYIVENTEEESNIIKIDDSLMYEIIGYLDDGKIISNNVCFDDEVLRNDFSYLNNQKVKWVIDRINLYFED